MRRMLLTAAFTLTASATGQAALPDGVQHQRDVIYGRKAGLAMTLDVLRPAKPNGAGLVLIVSAGFTSSPDMIVTDFADEPVRRGYTVFLVVHGSQPQFTVPEIVEDVHRAVRFVRHKSADYGVDPKRLAAGGASAGGLMALLQGTAGRAGDSKSEDPVEREPSGVSAVACFFPPTDYLNYGAKGQELTDITVHPPEFRAAYDYREFDTRTGLFARVTDKDRVRAIQKAHSPIYHVTARSAPTLIFHGDKDELVPVQQSEVFVARLKESGVPAKLVVKKGAGHGWLTMRSDTRPMTDWLDQHLPAAGKE
jgi:acetyl esterase/lipase